MKEIARLFIEKWSTSLKDMVSRKTNLNSLNNVVFQERSYLQRAKKIIRNWNNSDRFSATILHTRGMQKIKKIHKCLPKEVVPLIKCFGLSFFLFIAFSFLLIFHLNSKTSNMIFLLQNFSRSLAIAIDYKLSFFNVICFKNIFYKSMWYFAVVMHNSTIFYKQLINWNITILQCYFLYVYNNNKIFKWIQSVF